MSVNKKRSLPYVVGPRSIELQMNTCGGFLCYAEALKKRKTKNRKTETQTKVRMANEFPWPQANPK